MWSAPPARSWYFGLHLLCILVVLVLPVKPRRPRAKEQQDDLQKDGQAAHSSTDNNCNQKEKASWGPGQQRAVQSAQERWKLLQAGAGAGPFVWHRTKYWALWKTPTGRNSESMFCWKPFSSKTQQPMKKKNDTDHLMRIKDQDVTMAMV